MQGRKRETYSEERERGEKEKNYKHEKFMEFYLAVLHSAERSETRQWIVARQVSCYNPLSCFNPVTNNMYCVNILKTWQKHPNLILI